MPVSQADPNNKKFPTVTCEGMLVNAPTFEELVPGVLYDSYPAWSMTNLSHRPLLNKVPPSTSETWEQACMSVSL